MNVKIKPIKKVQKWSGFQGIRYKNTKHYLTAFYDKYGSMVTGLSDEDAERLGKILDRDLKNTSSFWHDFKVIMMDRELRLNLDKPEDELKYKLLLVHPLVKASESELNPKAMYVVYNEQEEAKVANTTSSVKIKANLLYSSLTANEKKEVLRLYPGYNRTDTVSSEVIDAKLYAQLEANPEKFVSIIEDKKRDMKILLKDLVTSRVLRKNKNAYYYGEDALGHDEESTITYLDSPEGNNLKVILMKELKSKK